MSVLELFLLEIFRNSFYCHLLFNYQGSLLSRDSLIRLSYLYSLVNNFLKLFFIFKLFIFKKRRKRDLNPRAGHPTYTLSRGASSAS